MPQHGNDAGRSQPKAHSGQVPRRTSWGTISREVIIQAATAAIVSGRSQDLSIRRRAAELGVAPMSLYRHIRSKDDLLDEVVDGLLAEAWRPTASPSDWQAWLMEAAEQFRQFLVFQPPALHVYLSHPVTSPAALARMDAAIEVLRQAGADEPAARSAYGVLHIYTIGFAALEAKRAEWVLPEGNDLPVTRLLAAYTSTDQFMAGLRYLLDGIAATALATRGHRAHRRS